MRRALVTGAVCVLGLVVPAAQGQGYPTKPVRLVTGGAGGGSDFTSRIIAQELTKAFGQQVIVENRGGASGAIAVQAVLQAPPDGHTLLYYSSSLWIIPLLQKVPWDTARDFRPITLAAGAPNILVVHPQLPVKSVRDLVALAKVRPGDLNYASAVAGSSIHLAAELFKSMTGTNIVQINYKGAGPAITDLISGQVQMMFASAGSVVPHVKAGRLRALAVTSLKPSALAPGLPTMVESGLPGFSTGAAYALFAPAKTSPEVVNRISLEVTRVLRQQEIRERFMNTGVESYASSPDELMSMIDSEVKRFGKVIKDAGIRLE